jgi:hypothetical protein
VATLGAIFPPTQPPERLSAVALAAEDHIAVNAAGRDANLEQFVRFLAREVNPRLA